MAEIKIDREKCKGCELCVHFCPKGCLEIEENINRKGHKPSRSKNSKDCTGCAICALVCPDVAIEVWR